MTSLTGKVAVVLGASAENGTGWAVAQTLAREGARVVVAARRMEPLRKLASAIGGFAVQCDAGKPEDIRALARAVVGRYDHLDVAVNTAAFVAAGTLEQTPHTDIQTCLDVNYIGQIYFIRRMAEVMRDGGAITLVSTAASTQPGLDLFAYGCSKAAADCLVRFAALEYAPRQIRVNSILPGPIKSELTQALFAVSGAEEAQARQIPLGRVGAPQDFAEVVAWLSRPGYITGVNLPVSGGMHLTGLPRADDVPGYRGLVTPPV